MSDTIQDVRPAPDERRSTGAVSVRGRPVRKAPLGWLPWVALLLAGIVGLGALLIARNVGDAGDRPGIDLTDDPAAPGQDPPGPEAGARGNAPAASAGAGAGSVTSGGTPLLPIPSGGLAAFGGHVAEGKGVNVESVVADEGFWIGSGPEERLFVLLTTEAKGTKGESPFQVTAGQKIDFAGTVRPLSGEPSRFGVDRNEGADQLRQQGHYIELRSIALAG